MVLLSPGLFRLFLGKEEVRTKRKQYFLKLVTILSAIPLRGFIIEKPLMTHPPPSP